MEGTDHFPVGLPTRLRPRRVLGSGSSATVWLARDTRAGRDVAVKVLRRPADPRADALLAARLEAEARSLARLDDLDGVVRVLEVGRTASGVGWIVSEHLPGGTLADRGPGSGAVAEVRAASARLARVLGSCHAEGVVHGDLTPSNVLFDASGRPSLADFGLSALGEELPPAPGLTPRFAAPERRDGTPPTPAGDVYALGATMRWWLLEDRADDGLRAALACAAHPDPRRRPTAAGLVSLLEEPARRRRG